jgi:3-dehydroquinate dehydratase-2
MPRILVIHGAGMSMRGKTAIETFGPMTLPDYESTIRGYASDLALDVDFFLSNNEGAVIDRLYAAHDEPIDGCVINPAGFMRGYPALVAALGQVRFPSVEVHISNPARRGVVSEVAAGTRCCVAGFGIEGYRLALAGLKAIIGR